MNNVAGFKKKYPNNWEIVKIGNVSTVIRGASPRPKGDPRYYGGKIPRLMVADVTRDGKWVTPKLDFLTNAGAKLSRPMGKGTLTIVCSGTVGIPSFLSVDSCIHDGFLALSNVSSEIDLDFLYHQIFLLKDEFDKSATHGGIFTNLTTDILKQFKFVIPKEKKEQQKIAKILTTVDNLIEKTESLIKKYQAIKQGMMHDLFTRGIDTNGQLRATYHEAPHLYKQTELGWIPKDWNACRWRELVSYSCYGPRFNASQYSEDGNVRTIRGMDFTKDGDILYDQVPQALLPNILVLQHNLENNDVIVVTTAECGLTAVFHEQKHKYLPSAYTVKFRFDEIVLPYFIKYYMQTDLAKEQVNKYVRQGTLGNLPGSDLLRFWIKCPNINEQKSIIKKINSQLNRIDKEKKYLIKLKKVKKGLMQDLLTGKVRVKL